MPAPAPRTAADVMTPDPRTCSTFSTVLEAVLIFRDQDCGAVPVLEDGQPVGILTDRDVALALASYSTDLTSRPVTDVMTRGVVSVRPGDGLDVVRHQFGDRGVRRLLVIDEDDRLVGIIAWSDLVERVPDRAVGEMVTDVIEHP